MQAINMPGRRERIKAASFPIAAESIDGAGELPQGDIFYQPPFLRPAEMPISSGIPQKVVAVPAKLVPIVLRSGVIS